MKKIIKIFLIVNMILLTFATTPVCTISVEEAFAKKWSVNELILFNNPNPANSSEGIHMVAGVDTSVNVTYENFEELTEEKLGTGEEFERYWVQLPFTFDVLSHQGMKMTQSFNSTDNNECSILKNLTLKCKRQGSPGMLKAEIYYSSDNLPYGAVLSSGEIDANSFTTNFIGADYSINMSPFLLEPGMKYNLLLYAPNSGIWNRVFIAHDQEGTYANGKYDSYFETWNEQTGWDMLFEIWGWSLGGNVTWDHVVNLSYTSNSSGTWQQYGFEYAYQNGIYAASGTNFTSPLTKYWWKVNGTVSSICISSPLYNFKTWRRALPPETPIFEKEHVS